jgi:hypothetical protein
MNKLVKNCPSNTAKIAYDRLLAAVTLDGYYQIDYYTGDLTVIGVYLPHGICVCNKYNQTMCEYREYKQFDLVWDCFSEYTQRMILLEVGDRYCY